MIQTTDLYKQLFNAGATQEYKIEIDGVTYTDDSIYSISLSENLFDKDVFTLGSFCSSQIKVKFKVRTAAIGRNATLKFFYRYTQGGVYSEWVQKFVGKVTGRTAAAETTTVEAKDVAANTDIFLDVFQTQVPSYPANAQFVAGLIARHLGLTLDNIGAIWNGDVVEYPNELSVIQVLKYIGLLSGGNWMITGNGRLRLAKPGVDYDVAGPYTAQKAETLSETQLISRVTVYWDDERAFTGGTDRAATLELDCPWATQDTTNALVALLPSFYYDGAKLTAAYLDPAIELGDYFFLSAENEVGNERQLGQVEQYMGIGNFLGGKHGTGNPKELQLCARLNWTFDGSCVADVESPNNNEYIYDDPYNTLLNNQFKRKLTLGDSYHGVTIGRQDGIQMVWSPDGTLEHATARFYADLTKGMAFQQRSDFTKEWLDWLYFDVNEKIFKLTFYNTKDEIESFFRVTNERITSFVGDYDDKLESMSLSITDAIQSSYNYTDSTKLGTLQEIATIYVPGTTYDRDKQEIDRQINTIETTANGTKQTLATYYTELTKADVNNLSSAKTYAETVAIREAGYVNTTMTQNYATNVRVNGIANTVTSHSSTIEQMPNQILQTVSQRYASGDYVDSQIRQLASNITLSVNANGNTGASISLGVYNPVSGGITTQTGYVNITGVVTFENLLTPGNSTMIDGGNINTTNLKLFGEFDLYESLDQYQRGATPIGWIGRYSGTGLGIALRSHQGWVAATSSGVAIINNQYYNGRYAQVSVANGKVDINGPLTINGKPYVPGGGGGTATATWG
jgi:hypothetical protein